MNKIDIYFFILRILLIVIVFIGFFMYCPTDSTIWYIMLGIGFIQAVSAIYFSVIKKY